MLVPAGELVGVGAGIRVRRAVGVALERDCRHGNHGRLGQPLFQGVAFRFAFGQSKSAPGLQRLIADADGIRCQKEGDR